MVIKKLIADKWIDLVFVHHKKAKRKANESSWIIHTNSLVNRQPIDDRLTLDGLYKYSNLVSISYRNERWNRNTRRFWKHWHYITLNAQLFCLLPINKTINRIGKSNLSVQSTLFNWISLPDQSTSFIESTYNTFNIKLILD